MKCKNQNEGQSNAISCPINRFLWGPAEIVALEGLAQSERVIDSGMRIARRDGVADPEQRELPRRIG